MSLVQSYILSLLGAWFSAVMICKRQMPTGTSAGIWTYKYRPASSVTERENATTTWNTATGAVAVSPLFTLSDRLLNVSPSITNLQCDGILILAENSNIPLIFLEAEVFVAFDCYNPLSVLQHRRRRTYNPFNGLLVSSFFFSMQNVFTTFDRCLG